MVFLLLSIACSSAILFLFRLFPKYQVQTPVAITLNYGVAMMLSLTEVKQMPSTLTWWMPTSLLLGILFILVFILMALTTKAAGVTMTSLASKLSMVIPIAFGVFFLKEYLGWQGMLGLLLAFVSVFIMSGPAKNGQWTWHIPALFLGTGLIDLCVSMFSNWIPSQDLGMVRSLIFGSAFVTGLFINFRHRFQRASVVAGLVLGVVNYGSLIFLMKSLESDLWPSAILFPFNNLGIIALSTLVALIFFAEKLTWRVSVGLGLGMGALALLAWTGA